MVPTRAMVVLAVLAAACATVKRPAPSEPSGFLDDYSLLREGSADEVAQVYRNTAAKWTAYDKVLLEPVTLWRSGRRSLDPVPEEDLLRLVADFQAAVRRRLGKDFAIVEQAGPGVMRIRLAITSARASDPILDVVRAHGKSAGGAGGPLHPELRQFLEGASIEGEIRDAESGELLAQGVDHRRRKGALPLDTWSEVDRALDFWTDRVCSRLEARTRGLSQ